MSASATRAKLRKALEESGTAWIFQYWGNKADKHLARMADALAEFQKEYERRYGSPPDPFDLLDKNPAKAAAFFQVDTQLVSLEMKIMIWRVLLGCEISRIEFKYDAGKRPTLLVTLRTPYSDQEEQFKGQKPDDFRILRHLGVSGKHDQLLLQGYYASRPV
jgi:hypothetical protein